MKLFIDPQGGMAGDMFAAALIDAGADVQRVTEAMLGAARCLGEASIQHVLTADSSSRLLIEVEHEHGHLSSSRALHLLSHLFEDYRVEEKYQSFGFSMLRHLIEAEKTAHQTFDFHMEGHHSHPSAEHVGEESVHHHHHHGEEPEAWLHEAQDILIDVMGAVMGLQALEAPVTAVLTRPVSVGGGTVTFSHGTLSVPAPATRVMINKSGIPIHPGPLNVELFTPTGAAVLSALSATHIESLPGEGILSKGFSRGTKDLEIPPLKVYLV